MRKLARRLELIDRAFVSPCDVETVLWCCQKDKILWRTQQYEAHNSKRFSSIVREASVPRKHFSVIDRKGEPV